MSKECKTCGYEGNPDDAEFCETCGDGLDNTFNSPSVSVASPPSPPSASPPSPPVPSINPPSQPITPPVGIIPPPPAPATVPQPPLSPTVVASISSPVAVPPVGSPTTARLVAKLSNAPVPEFVIDGYASVGIFTPESGPVDIDLEQFLGSDTISKQHAEIYLDNGGWTIKDQSTNGTFIKPFGQTRFGPRIMAPTQLNSGDEIAFAKISFIFQSP